MDVTQKSPVKQNYMQNDMVEAVILTHFPTHFKSKDGKELDANLQGRNVQFLFRNDTIIPKDAKDKDKKGKEVNVRNQKTGEIKAEFADKMEESIRTTGEYLGYPAVDKASFVYEHESKDAKGNTIINQKTGKPKPVLNDRYTREQWAVMKALMTPIPMVDKDNKPITDKVSGEPVYMYVGKVKAQYKGKDKFPKGCAVPVKTTKADGTKYNIDDPKEFKECLEANKDNFAPTDFPVYQADLDRQVRSAIAEYNRTNKQPAKDKVAQAEAAVEIEAEGAEVEDIPDFES